MKLTAHATMHELHIHNLNLDEQERLLLKKASWLFKIIGIST
jgi:hypothetical protein